VRALAACLTLLLAVTVPAWAQESEGVPVRVRANYLRYDRSRGVAYARGEAVVEYQDLVIQAEEILLDLNEMELIARGHVVLLEGGQRVTADQLTYNLRTRFGSLSAAETRWRDPLVQDPIHMKAARIQGNPEQRLCLVDAEVTTCDLNDPGTPYKLAAREIEFIPQDRVVMRDASLYLFGAKILTLPFFILFLREPRQTRIFPLVGYSEEEGFFIKATTTYFVTDEHLGFVYTDWMEKIGFGGGIEHLWRYDRGQGDYLVYLLQNRRVGGTDLRLRLQHRHDFGGGFAAGAFYDLFQRQFGEGSVQSSLYTSLDALYRGEVDSANLFASYSRSDTPGGTGGEFLSALVTYDRRLTSNLTGRLQVPYTATGGAGYTDLEATPRLDLTYTGGTYTLQLVAEHRLDLDGDAYTGDAIGSLSRLPEILYTGFPQAIRLGDVNLALQLQGGIGYFIEDPGAGLPKTAAVRLDAQAIASGAQALDPRTSVDGQVSVRLSSYTTGETRAILAGTVGLSYRWSDELSSRLVYTYKDSLGSTPFQFDRDTSRLHNARVQLTYRTGTFGADLSGGYDFIGARPDNLTLRVDWFPQPGWTVALATQFDPTSGSFTTVEANLRVRLSDQWEVAYRGSYTPTTGTLLHDTVQVTYYQDCWAASATYRGTDQVLWLEAWLTAFPQARGAIGLGQTGVLFQQPFLPPSPSR